MPPPSDDNPIIDALARAEHWLDERGRGAWIALIVLSFIVFWPLGLGLVIWLRLRRRGRSAPRPRRYAPAAPAPAQRDSRSFDDFAETLHQGAERDDFDAYLDARGAHLARDRQNNDRGPDTGREP